jgi:SNF2 family DNA or RNA helicase
MDRSAPLPNWLVYHQAFLLEQALGPEAFLAAQPGRLKPEPYQLVPVMRALRMSRPRLLLCDGVGLGKTIQAGLVVTELMARRLAHRILVVSLAGPLLQQWKMEFLERFGLRLEVVDRSTLEQKRRANELGANPFDDIPLGLVSIDFLKQERIVDQLERTSYDVVIIDEAHHCMDIGDNKDRGDTLRRRLAEVLARKCDSLLLLTAIPDDGTERSFPSLIELLDPYLVDGEGRLRGDEYRKHVIRRLKDHLGDKFKRRTVDPCPVAVSKDKHPHFIELHRAFLDLVGPELQRAYRTPNCGDVLSFIALLKRSVSTVAAFRETLQTIADRYTRMLAEGADTQENRRERVRSLREYAQVERFGALSHDEEIELQAFEVEDAADRLRELQNEVRKESRKLKRFATVAEGLDELVELSGAALEEDPKIATVIERIKAIRKEEPKANVLVYTEYTDS